MFVDLYVDQLLLGVLGLVDQDASIWHRSELLSGELPLVKLVFAQLVFLLDDLHAPQMLFVTSM